MSNLKMPVAGQRPRDSYDLVIVGSGAGAMTAALVAARLGKSVVIMEKEALFGGSSARSGGAVWLPTNHLMAEKRVSDSFERAMTYVRSCVKEYTPAATDERIETYVRTSPQLLRFLEAEGLKVRYAQGYSDYYDDHPGGEPMGRAIEADMLDSRELGEWASRVNRYALFAMPVYLQEFPALSNATRTMAGRLMALKLGLRLLKQKLRGNAMLAQGAALQGRLLKLVLQRGVDVFLETPMRELVIHNGAAAGVVVEHAGQLQTIEAKSVLLNAGGFSKNAEMRERYLPAPQTSTEYYLGNPGDTGEVLRAAMNLGAAVDQLNESWWIPGGIVPGGLAVSHTIDLSKPHCIMVDGSGERYVDEAMPYMEIGQTMFARQSVAQAVPSWAIFDSRHRKRYSWGMAMPGKTPPDWIESGYLKKADTLEQLASLCGIPAEKLRATVARFNGFARAGVDEDFGRGGRQYDRMNGDPSSRPNPSLGTIEAGPFYAAPVHVGDVGTCGGVVTDADGRVLRDDGSAIAGLYACGNIAANCFGRSYPGPGITLAQSMIFGYRAVRHAFGAND